LHEAEIGATLAPKSDFMAAAADYPLHLTADVAMQQSHLLWRDQDA
jgi:hypothetical protein